MTKLFTDKFKLYAYKNQNRCDLSILVNESTVLTFRLTHEEINRIFNEYKINDPVNNQYGVQFSSANGQYWFVMDKRHFQAVRITVGAAGIDFNFRVTYNEWEQLINDYKMQMSTPQAWDNK